MNDKQIQALALAMVQVTIEIEIQDDGMEGLLRSTTDDTQLSNEIIDDDSMMQKIVTAVRAIQSDLRKAERALLDEIQNDIDDDFFARHGTK